MSGIVYTCRVCSKKISVEEGTPAPLCCQKEMEPLPYCTKAPNAEMSRLTDDDGPCDDGVTKK